MTPRDLAVDGLNAVLHRGLSVDAVLADRKLLDMIPEDRSLVSALVYGVLRHRLLLDALIDRCLERPLRSRERRIRLALAIGFFQLGWMRIPAHAAVNETVAVVQARWARGLVNALLRRYQREGTPTDLEDAPLSVRYSHPKWLVHRIEAAWPEAAEQVLAENNAAPPMWLRVDRRRTERERYAGKVAAAGCPMTVPDAIRLEQPVDVSALPGFATGQVFVQDISAQRAAPLLSPRPGERVLDACAAPGGKTAHLLSVAPDGTVLAIDADDRRAERIRENLSRTGDSIAILTGDAARPEDWWDGQRFDAILVDAPCSGTGVIRRHPDIKWLRREDDLPRLAAKQDRLLAGLWPLLNPGGRMLYCTCSILPEENERVVRRFQTQEPGARAVGVEFEVGRSTGAGWQILPGEAQGDGFFYAMMSKT